jgi:hypothetical protein
VGDAAAGQSEEAERPDQGGGDREQSAPLAGRLAQGGKVQPLQVAQPAVDRLQAVPGGAPPEIGRLHEAHREPPRGRLPGRGRAVDAAADDHEVVPAGGEEGEVAAEHAGR